jgi:hypothetical protein
VSASDPLVELLARTSAALEAAGFSYAVIGALARNAWARPRATTDIDLAIEVSAERVDELRELLDRLGLAVRKERAGDSGVPELVLLADRREPSLRLDLLVAQTPFEESVLARKVRTRVGGQDLWVATAEDLVVYKLVAGRPRDWADAEEVARAREVAGTPIDWTYVSHWAGAFGLGDRVLQLKRRLG